MDCARGDANNDTSSKQGHVTGDLPQKGRQKMEELASEMSMAGFTVENSAKKTHKPKKSEWK